MNNILKICIIWHRLGPMHCARLLAIAKLSRVVALELCAKDNTYAWDQVVNTGNFERITLFNDIDSDDVAGALVAQRVVASLEKIKPTHLIVGGWSDPGQLAATMWAAQRGIALVGFSDSNEWDESRFFLKEFIKSRFVRLWGGALVGGKSHADYVIKLGFGRGKILEKYNSIDNRNFSPIKMAYDAIDGVHFSMSSKIAKGDQFICVARFIKKKNIPFLINAYAIYRTKASGKLWNLVILGDGHLRGEYTELIKFLGIDDYVSMPGFKQYEELPDWYQASRVFILPSLIEQWGNVVNEAMAAGLPVLVSQRCGSAHSLVHEAVNGYTFPHDNVEYLAELMVRLSSGSIDLDAFGARSKAIIQDYTPEVFAKNTIEVCRHAESSVVIRPRWFDWIILWILIRRPRPKLHTA